MKQFAFIATAICLVLLSACGMVSDSPPSQDDAIEISTESAPVTEESASATAPAPMGAALYRGTIADIQSEGGATVLTLEQAAGTNFGPEQLRVVLNETTRMTNIDAAAALAVGSYIEVYYGQPGDGSGPIQIGRAHV